MDVPEMVERVAKAILVDSMAKRDAWDIADEETRARGRSYARAAIEAFLAAASDRLDDNEALSDAIHAELKRQQAFSIEKHGTIALATAPFSSLVLAALSPSLKEQERT